MADLLCLDQVGVRYGDRHVLRDISLSLAAGEVGVLLGASGSGKSTLLRAIAGFEPVVSGDISISGDCVSTRKRHLPAHKRGVGMVFQDNALFPHLNVEENVAFGLQGQKLQQRRQRVRELLDLIGLPDRATAYPHQLSGGQQQRVALARALAPKPQLILLDEPFASLDSELRKQLAMEVRSVLKATNTTALLVTHDQQEAFAMADKLGLLADAVLQQWDTPYRLYHNPVNRLVANFVGEGVFLPASTVSNNCVVTSFGEFCSLQPLQLIEGKPVEVLIRPDDVLHDEKSSTRATVTSRQFRGAEFLYDLQLQDGHVVQALFPSHLDYAIGEHIGIRLELDHVITFSNGNVNGNKSDEAGG